LVVTNTGGGEQTFGVSWNGKFVRYTLPAGAIATLTWDGTPPDDGSIDPTKWYQTINQNSGKCVDATDWGTSNSTPVQQWACSVPAADNQLWQFRPTDSGFYHVVNRHGQTMAWDVTGGPDATSDRVPIQLWAYAGGTNQQWQPTALGGGYYTFAARHSGKCLDVTDVSTSDGTRLQQWTCTDGPAQSFRLAAQP